ncbi:MAG TPA: tetratricopeptide repeat protein [Nitratifractor sp.]|nr:tetratricopeptide repeat protein [Nitratifractor sp.]
MLEVNLFPTYELSKDVNTTINSLVLDQISTVLSTQQILLEFVATIIAVFSFIGVKFYLKAYQRIKELEAVQKEAEGLKNGLKNLKDTIFYITEGDKSVDSNKYDEAIRWYKNAIELDDHYLAYIKICNIYLKLNKKESALQYMKHAKALYPKNHLVLNALARVYRKKRKFENAKATYEATLKIKPDFIWSLAGLAEVYLHEREYKKAEELIKKILNNNDNILRYRLRVDLGLIYLHQNRTTKANDEFIKAKEFIEESINKTRKNDLLYSYKIIVLTALKEYTQALECVEEFGESIPIYNITYETIKVRLESLKDLDGYDSSEIENILSKVENLSKKEESKKTI